MALLHGEAAALIEVHQDVLVGRRVRLPERRGVADQGDEPVDLAVEPAARVHGAQEDGRHRDLAGRGVLKCHQDPAADRAGRVDQPARPAVEHVQRLVESPGEIAGGEVGEGRRGDLVGGHDAEVAAPAAADGPVEVAVAAR